MSNFLIDEEGNQVWYDLKSNKVDYKEYFRYKMEYSNQPPFWVRPHRSGKAAVISICGAEWFCIEGKSHREDGPAIIYADGDTEWCLNDKEYSFEKWCKMLNKSEEEINYFRLKYNI